MVNIQDYFFSEFKLLISVKLLINFYFQALVVRAQKIAVHNRYSQTRFLNH